MDDLSGPGGRRQRWAGVLTPYATPVVVVGLCGSILVASALSLASAATPVEALLVGLVIVTAALVVDGTVRAERRFRLRTLVESSRWLDPTRLRGPGEPGVAGLARSAQLMVERHPAPEVVAEARLAFRRLADDFEELTQGRIVRPRTDYDLLIAATDGCHRRLQAVADVHTGLDAVRWWDGDAGQRYWAANLDALSRGVAITRVFLCDGMDSDLADLIAAQSRAGVTAQVLYRDMVDAALHGSLVVWDGRRGWERRRGAGGDVVAHVLTVNDEDLRRMVDAFTTCSKAARAASI